MNMKLTKNTASGLQTSGPKIQVEKKSCHANTFILDGLYLKTPDVKNAVRDNAKTSDKTDYPFIDASTARKLRNALVKASGISPIKNLVVTHVAGKKHRREIKIPYDIVVQTDVTPGATDAYAVFTLIVEPQTVPSCRTKITVTLSCDNANDPQNHQVAIHSNPTSLLTGQNDFPMRSITGSTRADLAIQFAAPFAVVTAVCQRAVPEYKPSFALVNAFERGNCLVQNMQFALYMDMPCRSKQVALALLEQAYEARPIRFDEDSKCLKTYTIGRALRVKAQLYEKPVDDCNDGSMSLQTTLLRKRSGTHDVVSFSIYDKVQEAGLSKASALTTGLSDQLRIDVTPQDRGIDKLLNSAGKLFKRVGGETKLTKASTGKGCEHTARNVIAAISLINRNFSAKFGDKKVRGFAAWLMLRFGNDEFFLQELFGSTEASHRQLRRLFAKLTERDSRYGIAFAEWDKDHFATRTLRQHLHATGLKGGTVNRCLLEAKELGCSGKVPPEYYRDRYARWERFGETRADRDAMSKRNKTGKSVVDILGRNRQHMQPAIVALQKAIASAADQSKITLARVAGDVLLPVSKADTTSIAKNGKRQFTLNLPHRKISNALPSLSKVAVSKAKVALRSNGKSDKYFADLN